MLDFRLFNWTNITLSNAPSGRDGYVSALLSDGNILYLGGYTFSQTVGLDIVIFFNFTRIPIRISFIQIIIRYSDNSNTNK